MNENKKEELTALTLAYQAVIRLGYQHHDLKKMDCTVNYPTLRRISKGKKGKACTDSYYLAFFVALLNERYESMIRNGGDGASAVLRTMKDILLAVVFEAR